MKRNIITIAIAATMVTSLCFTEEIEVEKPKDSSLRISIGNTPGIDEVETAGGSFEAPDEGGVSIQVLGTQRFWSKNTPAIGGVFGGGLFLSTHSASEAGESIDTTAFGGIFEGGLAVKAGEKFVFELLPFIGLGVGFNDIDVPGFIEDSGTGLYVMYGVKGGAYFSVSDALELGLEAGLYAFEQDQEIDFGGFTEDFTFSGSGASVSLVCAVKF